MKNKLVITIAAALLLRLTGPVSAAEGVVFKTFWDSVVVHKIVQVQGLEDIRQALAEARSKGLKVAIAGARHAQGGQQWYPDGIVLDMTGFNKIISLDRENKVIRVQSGVIWKQVQDYIRPYGYAIRVMQSVNILTVGGSLGSNIRGTDPNYGSIIETVKSFHLMQADGKVINVSREENSELFSLVIGGYGLFGVIIDVDLLLTDNVVYKENSVFMDYKKFPSFLQSHILNHPEIGGMDASFKGSQQGEFETLKVTTYTRVAESEKNLTTLPPEEKNKYIARDDRFTSAREPSTWKGRPIIQEYFVPTDEFIPFIDGLKKIFRTEPVIHVRPYFIRYAKQDQQSFLTYVKKDSFAVTVAIGIGQSFSVQDMKNLSKQIDDLALNCGGTFYLTKIEIYRDKEQLLRAYPAFNEFVKKKKEYDPQEVFMNKFYAYYR